MSLRARFSDGGEHSAYDGFALDAGEPDLNLIEPRRVGWREVQTDFRARRLSAMTWTSWLGAQNPATWSGELTNSSLV